MFFEILCDNQYMDKTLDRLYEITEGSYYASDILSDISKAFKLQLHKVSYGKFVFQVYVTEDGFPVGVYPNRNMRGWLVIRHNGIAWDAAPARYDVDPCSPHKWLEAALEVLSAFGCRDPYAAMTTLGVRSGRCCICGACLTDALSMSRGIGPECIKKIGVRQAYRQLLSNSELN